MVIYGGKCLFLSEKRECMGDTSMFISFHARL